MRKVPRTIENAARFFHLESWFRLLLLCALVGVVSGRCATANCTACLVHDATCAWCVAQSGDGSFVERCAPNACDGGEIAFRNSCPVYATEALPAWKILLEPANLCILLTLLISVCAGSHLSLRVAPDPQDARGLGLIPARRL